MPGQTVTSALLCPPAGVGGRYLLCVVLVQ